MKGLPIHLIKIICGMASSPVSLGKEMLSVKTEAHALNHPFLGKILSHQIFSLKERVKRLRLAVRHELEFNGRIMQIM